MGRKSRELKERLSEMGKEIKRLRDREAERNRGDVEQQPLSPEPACKRLRKDHVDGRNSVEFFSNRRDLRGVSPLRSMPADPSGSRRGAYTVVSDQGLNRRQKRRKNTGRVHSRSPPSPRVSHRRSPSGDIARYRSMSRSPSPGRYRSASRSNSRSRSPAASQQASLAPRGNSRERCASESSEDCVSLDTPLDADLLKVLGEPTEPPTPAAITIRKELADRWTSWLTQGMSVADVKEATEKIGNIENCPSLITPVLNEELAESLPAREKHRDTEVFNRQSLLTKGLTALGRGMDLLLKGGSTDKTPMVLEQLHLAGKLFTTTHYKITMARRNQVLTALDPIAKTALQGVQASSKLFGDNVTEKLTVVKTTRKTAEILKKKNERATPRKYGESYGSRTRFAPKQSLNWRRPSSSTTYRQDGPIRKPSNVQNRRRWEHHDRRHQEARKTRR